MKKFGTKFTAVAAATAMALALTPATAFAADTDTTAAPASGQASSDATLEGLVDKDVFCVVLPTVAESGDDSRLTFILDPQDLITATKDDTTKKHSETFTGDGLYFLNVGESGNTYSGSSDELSVINKSTSDVEVKVTATVSNATAIDLVEEDALDSTTARNVYLGLSMNGGAATTLTAKDGATATAKIEAKSDAYKVTYTEGSGYSYEIDESTYDEDSKFNAAKFNLVGKCNQQDGVDWTALQTTTPNIKLAWTVDKYVADPVLALSDAGEITITGLSAKKNVSGLTAFVVSNGTTSSSPTGKNATITAPNWTAADGGDITIQLGSAWKTFNGATVTVTVTLTDGTKLTATSTADSFAIA